MSNSLTVAAMYFTNKFLTTDLESVLKILGDNIHLTITFLIFQKFLQDYQCSRRHFMMTGRHRCNSMWGTTRLMLLEGMEHWLPSWCGKQELCVFNFRKTEPQGHCGRQFATFWQNLVYSFYMNEYTVLCV